MKTHFSFSGKCGDRVTWSSQAGGRIAVKTGVIVEVVPAGASPKIKVRDAGSPRDHESYVVLTDTVVRDGQTKVESKKYWPLVSHLQLVPTQDQNNAALASFGQAMAPAPQPTEVKPPVKLVNHFVICLDRSGSMQPIQRNAVDTFNQNTRSVQEGAVKSGQEATISLVTFGGNIQTKFFCDPVAGLRELSYNEYRPDGNTPLFDAVGRIVEKLRERKDASDENTSFMFIVITDGEENASTTYPTGRPELFRNLLAEVQKTDRWSFAFLLPPGNGEAFTRRFGIPSGNVCEWEASARGMAIAAQSVSQGISGYFDSRSQGMRSTKGFFVTDMTKISAGEVRARLTDIRNQVKIAEVNRTVMIRDFVEKDLRLTYSVGKAFYQLMKDEKVQYHKKVILRERGTDAVYAGTEARHLLGLPDSIDVKVRPGDHANWDVFVQSTSVNRKLVPGTKLLYLQ